jgi:hypothetical protein
LIPFGNRLLERVDLLCKLKLGDGILRLGSKLKSGIVLLGWIGEGLVLRFVLDDVSVGVHVTDF